MIRILFPTLFRSCQIDNIIPVMSSEEVPFKTLDLPSSILDLLSFLLLSSGCYHISTLLCHMLSLGYAVSLQAPKQWCQLTVDWNYPDWTKVDFSSLNLKFFFHSDRKLVDTCSWSPYSTSCWWTHVHSPLLCFLPLLIFCLSIWTCPMRVSRLDLSGCSEQRKSSFPWLKIWESPSNTVGV